jgi:TonB-linked SusC/RagA family outer membrane protein
MQKNIAFARGQHYALLNAKLYAKLLFIMRVSIFCFTLLLTSLQLLASTISHAQSISETSVKFGVTNESLNNALKKLQNESGYTFFYPSEKIASYDHISVETKERSVKETLGLLLENTDLDFKQQNNDVIIFEKTVITHAAPKIIYIIGKVVDEKKQPLPGVTIKIKGSNSAWTTNQNGAFIAATAVPNAILQFTFIGYITQEIPADQLKNPAVIVLKEDISKLDEVQVIAYGTTTKRANTGDITTVKAETIAQYPTTNVLDVLQGTVPGLNVYKNTGNAQGTYKVQIRGINGLGSAQPLYVIDGIPFRGGGVNTSNLNLGANTANGGNAGGYDALGGINPDDIESISVLKDADATAIYGSRGADGVILITTKKGKTGAPRISATVYSGVNDVAHFQHLLNLQQYLQMRHEAKTNDKSAISPTDYDINGGWDSTRSTNWQKALIGGYGHNTNAQLGISGGSEDVQYRINGGYNYTSDLEHLGGSDQTASLNVNISSITKDKKFSVVFTGGYLYDINTQTQSDLTGDIVMAPDAPALYTSTGALNFQNNTFYNPLIEKNNINHTPSYNLTSSLTLSYKPIKDLEIKLTTGYNKRDVNEFLGVPSNAVPPYLTLNPYSQFTYNTSTAWSIEPQVDYTKKIGKGTLLATAGASLQDENYTTMSLETTGYSSDLLLSSPTAGTTITTVSPYSVSPQKFAALFGRLNYNWADKYYIDLTGRDDGSSNFGQNRQYHFFAAAGAGWIFSEESLIKNNLEFLNFGKLRGSYGTTGRDNISPYSYLSTYSSNGVSYSGVAGLTPTRLPNPNLSWETTTKAELGIDLQFLKGRIALTTNFYRNRTTGVLANSALSLVTGFGAINENMPATVQNAGFDISLTTTNFKNKNFSWNTTFLFTRDRNKLLSYPNLATSPYANEYVIGQPVDITKVYRFGGVNQQTGIYQFYGANGQITAALNSVTDKTVLINVDPNFYGSIQNNISYKQFSLSFLLRGIKQMGRNAFYNMGIIPPGFSANNNYNTQVLSRWQKPGDVTNIQRYGTSIFLLLAQNNAVQSNAAYGDASYIRLQNISFSYTLPKNVVSKMHMQSLQVFLQGENMFTISRYNGMDPENQSAYSLPPLRVMTAGLRLTL